MSSPDPATPRPPADVVLQDGDDGPSLQDGDHGPSLRDGDHGPSLRDSDHGPSLRDSDHGPSLRDSDHGPSLRDSDHGPSLRDEVDRLAAAWQRERPDLDVSPMQVLSRVTRLARHLDRERSAAFAGSGLESWEFDVLAALRRAGPGHRLSPGQLLKETMVTSGTMTNRVDRLAARGLVARDPHPDDRRAVLVRLTDEGRSAVDTAFADLMAAEQRILADLAPAHRTALTTALRALLAPYGDV